MAYSKQATNAGVGRPENGGYGSPVLRASATQTPGVEAKGSQEDRPCPSGAHNEVVLYLIMCSCFLGCGHPTGPIN